LDSYNNGSVLRLGGMFTVVLSVAVGLLVLFVLPTACSVVGGLQLVFLGFLGFLGLCVFIVGLVLLRRKAISSG